MIPVKVEGTLDELRALFGDVKRVSSAVVETAKEKKKQRLRRLDVSYQNGNVTLETKLTTSKLNQDQEKDD